MPNFQQILEQERAEEILIKDRFKDDSSEIQKNGFVGLALSGGGIRSATFNLGVLQGLAKFKLLHRIHYLATVSGGGYIGSWLITWIKREAPNSISARPGIRQKSATEIVEEKLGDYAAHPDPGGPAAEPEEINFLRDYSNYLTPRKGIFGADTWAGIATYLRNVLLNQFILIAFLGSILLLPWAVVHIVIYISRCIPPVSFFLVASTLGVIAAILVASWQVALCSRTEDPPHVFTKQLPVLFTVVLPLFIGALFFVLFLWNDCSYLSKLKALRWYQPVRSVWFWCLVVAVLYFLAHLLGLVPRWLVTRNLPPGRKISLSARFGIPGFAAVAGGVGGLLVFLLTRLIAHWQASGASAVWYAASFGPPLLILVFLLIGAVHIGLLKRLINPEEQEWWARLAGWLLIWSLAWAGLFSLAIFAPLGKLYLANWAKTEVTLSAGWLLTTVAGLLSGRSKKTTGKSDGHPVLERVASIAPYVFVVGLLVMLSIGVHELASRLPQHSFWSSKLSSLGTQGKNLAVPSSETPANFLSPQSILFTVNWKAPETTSNSQSTRPSFGTITVEQKPVPPAKIADDRLSNYWTSAKTFSPHNLAAACLALFGIVMFLALRVDINVFSMNLLYRNRIVRCYLGATRPEENRHANPFTGFDPRDDQLLKNFSVMAEQVSESKPLPYDGPYPILCAALNVTHGERLAWQERKAESFIFTPRYCGFDFPEMHLIPQSPNGYRATPEFAYPRSSDPKEQNKIGGVHVGTAMSISGAAASPNMGFHTSPPLAFLMTVFDVRLGWWLPNPRFENARYGSRSPEHSPRFSLFYLLHELFASTTDRSKYVYVSDGGHFENLAIYELVRRGCRYIIAGDADADENMAFADLGNAIRKCRSDFGVEISIDPSPLHLGKSGFAKTHAVLGTIKYPFPEPEGKLLYIKTTTTMGDPADVLAYRAKDPAFPHKTTADQWFDESQFESYRRLGLHSVESLVPPDDGNGPYPPSLTVEELFNTAKETIIAALRSA